jgi:26S proteasome regulatory subunit N6
VEQKLSEMILDKKFHGILDQGTGDLLLFEDPESDKTYAAALSTVQELALVVDRLYKKAATVSM